MIKKCPVCGSKRFVVNDRGVYTCKRCRFRNTSMVAETEARIKARQEVVKAYTGLGEI